MSGQSDILQQLISHFKLKNGNSIYLPSANQFSQKQPHARNKADIALPGGNNLDKY
jgi:hypothetical protein